MSLLYGIWRPQACSQTTDDCTYFANAFADWKCDYAGSSTLGPVAFGSRVFRTYHESKEERQPVEDKQRQVMLVADCRLDNREELASALCLDSITLKQTPDSELILKAYQRWSKDCFKRLEGDFAIALWDNSKHELLLVRDVMGLRPLAYATWQGGFAFCSSIPELYHLPSVPAELDDLKMAAQFIGHPTGRERTAFEAIKWVHPGKVITFCEGRVSKQTFAEISPISLSKEDQKNPAPHLGELLKQSVQKRIRGESDIICELSGGFDSGSITALTATLLKGSPRKLKAISWAPDPSEVPVRDGPDERKQIQWMEKRYGFRCHYFHYARPNDSIASKTYRNSFRERATSAIGGAQTILSGWGGDEAATFYLKGYHPQLLLRDGAQAALIRLLENARHRPFCLGALLRLIRSTRAVLLPRTQKDASPLNKLFNLKTKWREQLTQEYGSHLTKDLDPRNTQDCILHQLSRGHLEYRASRDSLDAARTGTTMAFPMLDSNLTRFILSIEASFFSYNSQARRLFRKVLKELSIELSPETKKLEPALSALAGSYNPQLPRTSPLEIELSQLQDKFLVHDSKSNTDLQKQNFTRRQILGVLALFEERRVSHSAIRNPLLPTCQSLD